MIDQECAKGFTAKLGGVKVAHTVRTGKLIAAAQPAKGGKLANLRSHGLAHLQSKTWRNRFFSM
jgi:hypothetical protein